MSDQTDAPKQLRRYDQARRRADRLEKMSILADRAIFISPGSLSSVLYDFIKLVIENETDRE